MKPLIMRPTEIKSILVTGGCGFIGSNFVNYIANHYPQTKVINLDKVQQGSSPDNVLSSVQNSGNYQFVYGNYGDEQLMLDTLKSWKVDTVVHFAAMSHVDESFVDPTGCFVNNVTDMVPMLEACKKYGNIRTFVHISTDEVYGDSELGEKAIPKKESDPLDPTNPYAASKAAAEQLVNAYRHSSGLPVVMIRMNNVYGPRQYESKVIPKFIQKTFNDQPLTLQGDGTQLRNWLFVGDACQGIRMIMESGRVGQAYNIGTRYEHSILEVATKIQQIVSEIRGIAANPISFVPIPNRPYNDSRYLIDTTKINKEIGWSSSTSFDEGLRLTVAWYYMQMEKEL